ncbi:exported hypothetical protein [Vibrio nigripulchritudo SFn118]|nr:exported hypothetical protein [Vibrio nigripulchritudo SFn118]
MEMYRMKNKVVKVATIAAFVIAAPVSGKALRMGTGGETGNYYSMGKDIHSYCAEDISRDIEVASSKGSVDNLLGMTNKEYAIGMVQEDVLQFNAKRSPKKVNKNRMKVITGLHEEAVHLLIPKGYKPQNSEKKGWKAWFSSSDGAPKKFDLAMLKGQKVGSWGGSMVSAEALGYFYDLNLKVTETKFDVNNNSLPIILVGGAPYKPVVEYLASGKWDLAPLDYNAISQTAGFYSNQTVNYQINGKVKGVPTVGIRALLIGKAFRKKSRNAPMTEMATCIYANVADLADDPDTNPNWSSVYDHIDSEGQSDWSYFPLNEDKLAEYEEL